MDLKDNNATETMPPVAKEMMQHAQTIMQDAKDMVKHVQTTMQESTRMYYTVNYVFDGLFIIGLAAVVILLSKVLKELRKR